MAGVFRRRWSLYERRRRNAFAPIASALLRELSDAGMSAGSTYDEVLPHVTFGWNPGGSGLIYYVIYPDTATDPSAAQILAGTDGDDVAAISNDWAAPSASGYWEPVNPETGLEGSTDYRIAFVWDNGVDQSNVVYGSYTTPSAAVAVGNTLTPTFDIQAAVGASITATFGVQAAVGATVSPTFDILNAVGSTLAPGFEIQAAVGSTLTPTFDIESTGVAVGNTLTPTFDIQEAVGATLAPSFAIEQAVGSTLTPSFAVQEAVGSTLTPSFQVQGPVGNTLTLTFTIDSLLAPDGSDYERWRRIGRR